MKLLFLGTGGAMPTPRPFCQCETCKKARTIGAPYKRNSSSLFIKDINTVIDCGEDIASSLNRENIKEVDNLFITHWHPDHTFGLRAIIEANFNFRTNKPNHVINLYIPKNSLCAFFIVLYINSIFNFLIKEYDVKDFNNFKARIFRKLRMLEFI